MNMYAAYTTASMVVAFFLAILLACLLAQKYKSRSTIAFGCAMFSILIACICDGLSYVRTPQGFPTTLIHAVLGIDMVIGDVALFCFTAYCYFFISERTTLDKRLFYIPQAIIAFCIAYTILCALQGKVYEITESGVIITGGKPLISSIADLLFMAYMPVIALLKRRAIGLKAVLLLGAFGILPFTAYLLAITMGFIDLSFIASALSLIICFLLLQNNQKDEWARKQNDAIAEAGMGVWAITIHEGREAEMVVNETMKDLMGIKGQQLSPQETYRAWHDNVVDMSEADKESSGVQLLRDNVHERTYRWMHPTLGERVVRTGGSYKPIHGGYLLSGYHYDVTDQVGEKEKQDQIISSLAYAYDYLAYISMEDMSFVGIDNKLPGDTLLFRDDEHRDAVAAIRNVCREKVSPEFREQMERFTDLSTLNRRMKGNRALFIQYKNDRDIWLTWTYIAVDRDPDGTLKHVICALRVIDEEKQEQLRQQRIIDENIAANKVKSMFLQNMSHEIRTPLNAMFGFSQLLGLPDGTWTEDEKAVYNKHVLNSFNMLEMLIGDILDVADSEHDNYIMYISETDVNAVCEDAIMMAEYRKPAGVEMYFTTELPEGYTIQSDGRRIQQVLINYLTNACKHTESGEIHLHCSSSENPGKITFSVTDTGCGVPADKAEVIFNRFMKLNKFDQGSGLGLNICKLIADKLKGEVYLDTTYSNGARFVFVLDNASTLFSQQSIPLQ